MEQTLQSQNQNKNEKVSEWASQEEVIKTSIPVYLTLGLIKFAPKFFVNFMIRVISLFYYIFSKRARNECLRFQKQFIYKYPDGEIKKPSVFKQICSFAITFVEKLECWVKDVSPIKIKLNDDDVKELIDRLNNGKGAFIICSHLGNSEVLRNFANHDNINVDRKVPISVLMDLGSTKNFTNTIEKINPGFSKNIIDINNINPGTIEILQDTIDQGGIVVSAGDRISKSIDSKYLNAEFLGKEARWSYGVYLIAMLLKVPVYFMFGMREKAVSFNRKYNLYVTKSKINTDCSRKERETNIKNLCLEFAGELENHCRENPYQWYNFYDFWAKAKQGESEK